MREEAEDETETHTPAKTRGAKSRRGKDATPKSTKSRGTPARLTRAQKGKGKKVTLEEEEEEEELSQEQLEELVKDTPKGTVVVDETGPKPTFKTSAGKPLTRDEVKEKIAKAKEERERRAEGEKKATTRKTKAPAVKKPATAKSATAKAKAAKDEKTKAEAVKAAAAKAMTAKEAAAKAAAAKKVAEVEAQMGEVSEDSDATEEDEEIRLLEEEEARIEKALEKERILAEQKREELEKKRKQVQLRAKAAAEEKEKKAKRARILKLAEEEAKLRAERIAAMLEEEARKKNEELLSTPRDDEEDEEGSDDFVDEETLAQTTSPAKELARRYGFKTVREMDAFMAGSRFGSRKRQQSGPLPSPKRRRKVAASPVRLRGDKHPRSPTTPVTAPSKKKRDVTGRFDTGGVIVGIDDLPRQDEVVPPRYVKTPQYKSFQRLMTCRYLGMSGKIWRPVSSGRIICPSRHERSASRIWRAIRTIQRRS